MVRKFTMIALAGALIAATPALADALVTPPDELMTTVTTDISKGLAEFNPTEILTPKPIEPPAAAAPAKVKKKKRHARRRTMKKKA